MKRIAVPVGALVLVSAALTLALSTQPAVAACGGVETAKHTKVVNPGGRPPLAIGDSAMLLALPDLAAKGYNVNARGCRMWAEGLDVIRKYKRDGRLPHLVTIALGADWIITKADIHEAMRLIGKKRVLGVVVPRETGGGTSNDADVCRWAGKAYTKRVMVLDWVRFSKNHGEWFQPDGLHLTFPGAAAYARLMRAAIPYARAGEFPRGDRFPN